MQVAIVPVQICTGTVACAYNFLTIFSLSSLYLTLSSLSLSRRTTLSFFLSSNQSFFLSSIFLPLASVDRHRRRHRQLFFLPLFLVVFGLNGLDQWVSSWMGLNVSRHRHRLPLEVSILFLILAIATGGVDLVAQGKASIPGGLCGLCCWVCFDSRLLDYVDYVAGLCWFRVRRSCCWVCFSSFLPVGCVDCVAGFVRFWVAGLCC